MWTLVWLLLLVLSQQEMATCSRQEDAEAFVATEEWQDIKPDQRVPSGLHYRINMQTGRKEAKILDLSEDHHDVKASSVDRKGAVVRVGGDDKEDGDANVTTDPERLAEMKKLVGKLKMTTEVNEIKALMAKFPNSTDEQKVIILEDLDYYMHQIDNARNFVTLGGLGTVIEPSLASKDPQVAMMGALVLGSASQSNLPVQNSILDTGIVDNLLHLIKHSVVDSVKRRSVYALSSFTRGNLKCLEYFVEKQGLEALLSGVLEDPNSASADLKLKSLRFVSDMWRENSSHPSENLVRAQVRASKDRWCEIFTSERKFYELAEFDFVETLSEVMASTFAELCAVEFNQSALIKSWLDRSKQYIAGEMKLINADDDDTMRLEYVRCLANINQILLLMIPPVVREEL